MHTVKNWAVGLLAAAAVATASDVHDLNKETFGDFIKTNDLVLAEFFAPWWYVAIFWLLLVLL